MTVEFWVIFGAIFFAESSFGPFNDNLNELLVRRFGVSYADSGRLLLIPWAGLTVLTFVFGNLLRHRPRLRRISIAMSSVFHLTAMTALYLLPNCTSPSFVHYLMIVMFLLSVSIFSTVYYCSLTTSVPFLVKESVLGTAWGFSACAIGFAQCLTPGLYILIMGDSNDLTKSFTHLNLFGVGVTSIYVCFALWIFFKDYSVLDTRYRETVREGSESAESLIETNDVL